MFRVPAKALLAIARAALDQPESSSLQKQLSWRSAIFSLSAEVAACFLLGEIEDSVKANAQDF
jgi:hypothetical protein